MRDPTEAVESSTIKEAEIKIKELREWCRELIREGEISEVL